MIIELGTAVRPGRSEAVLLGIGGGLMTAPDNGQTSRAGRLTRRAPITAGLLDTRGGRSAGPECTTLVDRRRATERGGGAIASRCENQPHGRLALGNARFGKIYADEPDKLVAVFQGHRGPSSPGIGRHNRNARVPVVAGGCEAGSPALCLTPTTAPPGLGMGRGSGSGRPGATSPGTFRATIRLRPRSGGRAPDRRAPRRRLWPRRG